MTTQQRATGEPAQTAGARRTGACPAAAAAFAAGIVYLWGEAAFRLLFTYFPGFDARWVLWNGRVGDIAAMWLTISGAVAATGAGLYLLWRRKDQVGTFAAWMIVLTGSAIAAPMIGEIGNTAGSVTSGAGSTSAVAIITYSLLGLVVIAAGAAFARLRAKR
jgi:LPXTG-motif cell wall-anchored protein